MGVAAAATRLCLDSRPLTWSLFALRRTGLLRGAGRARLRRLLTAAFSRVHFGGDGFAIRADAGRDERRAAYALTGWELSRVTGLVAAEVTRELLNGGLPAGVHHVEHLPAPADRPERLAADGVVLWHRTA